MIFKIYESDFGIKLNGVSYNFTHVQSMALEDPENTKLIRGANAGNKEGLVYKEGLKDPKRLTVTIIDMDAELKAVLDGAFDDKSRLDVYCISRVDGSSKMGRNAILATRPQQLQIDESPDSMNVVLTFETFDFSEVHKA
jgi:hypothetical protein